jgi:hypothetical protein
MPAITTLRSSIAAALTDNTKWSVFSFPPATAIAPLANFQISILVPLLDNQGNLAGIEDDIIRVFQLLEASSIVFNVGSVSAPAVLNLPTGDLLTCNVQISTLTEWS